MTAYYNEIDPFAAQWLRNLIAAKLIASGDVDERSIVDVSPDDLAGYTQAHFFAGIGGWSYALRLAGWPDDRPVWTGSCPCQPFSSAGKGDGTADPRHLWPAWVRLIRECRPHALLGEQVSGVDGLAWLDLVHTDLEACDYAVGAVTLPAASVGAPHQRHRIFWVADAELPERRAEAPSRNDDDRQGEGWPEAASGARQRGGTRLVANTDSGACGQGRADGSGRDHRGDAIEGAGSRSGERARLVGDPDEPGPQGRGRDERAERPGERAPRAAGVAGGMGDAEGADRGLPVQQERSREHLAEPLGAGETRGPCNGFWRDAEWLYCRDGKYRPTIPAALLLAHGYPADVGVLCATKAFPSRAGLLKGFGNAIVPQVAAAFVRAYMQTRGLAPQEREGEGR